MSGPREDIIMPTLGHHDTVLRRILSQSWYCRTAVISIASTRIAEAHCARAHRRTTVFLFGLIIVRLGVQNFT